MKLMAIPPRGHKLVSYLGECLSVPEYTTHIASDSDGELWAYDGEPDTPKHHFRLPNAGWWSETRKDGSELRNERIDTLLSLGDPIKEWEQSVRAVVPWVKFPRVLFVITYVACDGEEGIGLEVYKGIEKDVKFDTLDLADAFLWIHSPQGEDYWAELYVAYSSSEIEKAYSESLK